MLTKVLIANRGEIAVRIARTCREMGIATVGVHSDADADALHVEACDEAVRIGGSNPAGSYLRIEALLDAARRTGADAVHPGYGFLAESADFAAAVGDAGLVWVGPAPATIAAMGDKLAAKSHLAAAGVPVLDHVVVVDGTDLAAAAERIGYPVMVKAVAGGGGKGMRVAHRPAQLADAVTSAHREAEAAFGDGRVFLERFVAQPRHVEVQILGDAHGNVVHLFERECSIQRRHQKVIEESPAPAVRALGEALRDDLCAAAVAAAKALDYVGAGTVEFVVSGGAEGAFSFLEVNTRLQVEHPVTELVTDLDLVRLQLLVAAGEPLPFSQDDLAQEGHAIEARLYAEDPAAGFLPSTGHVAAFALGPGEDVRLDAGVRAGETLSTFYDPLLAKVIAWAPTRDEAAARLARALDRLSLLVTPPAPGQRLPATNRDLLVAILRHPAFVAGETTTAFLDEHFPRDDDRAFAPADEAILAAVAAVTLRDVVVRRAEAEVLATLPAGWSNTGGHWAEVVYTVAGREVGCRYLVSGQGGTRLVIRGHRASDPDGTIDVAAFVHGVSEDGIVVELDGRRLSAAVATAGPWHAVVTAAGRATLVERPRFHDAQHQDEPGVTLSPMPGTVITVAVDVGEQVVAGQPLVSVEAMKMEHRITAPTDGTVTEVRVAPGDQVAADQILVVVDVPDEA